MKSIKLGTSKPGTPSRRVARLAVTTVSLLVGAVVPFKAYSADSSWTGAVSSDWNDPLNWTEGVPSGGNALINTVTPNIATITSTIAATPVDIQVAGGAFVGQVDHISGDAFTGVNNWMLVGYAGGVATYNLADTTLSGSGFTGYGLGSGNLLVGNPESTGGGNLLLGLDAGTVTTFNVNTSGRLSVPGTIAVGSANGGVATINLDNGSVEVGGEVQFGSVFYGQGQGGGGTLNMSGGSFTANSLVFSRGANASSTLTGSGTITGGTLNSRTWLTLGFAGNASAIGAVTNSGGTINVNTAGSGNMEMTVYDATEAMFVQNSGALNLLNNAYISFGNGGNHSGIATFDQNGGTVTFYSDGGTNAGGTGHLNLGSGNSSGTYTYNLNGGTLTVPRIQKTSASAFGTFNFNGGTLKATTNSASFINDLSVNVLAGGAIIDTAGWDVTVKPMLQDGGGGGLTKLGEGTLTLAGGYYYSGSTIVSGGTLEVSAAFGNYPGSISVTDAALGVLLSDGAASLYAGAITFSGATALNLDYGAASAPGSPAISATSISVTGTNIINISGTALTIGTYPLIYTGSSVPTNNFRLGSLPTGVVARLADSGSSLDLVITAAGQNLTWYGADSNGNLLPVWNINSSMNWNYGTARYLQYSGNSYGDNVVFDDSVYPGAADVTLNTTVVPTTVKFNASQNYSIAGTGGIAGSTAVQVLNSGSVSLLTSNSYTGGTIITGGNVVITNDSGLGNASSLVTLQGGGLQFDGPVVSTRPITIGADSSLSVIGGTTAQLNGAISGSGALTKLGDGKLTLGGTVTQTGPINIGAGSVNLTGTAQATYTAVGSTYGDAILNVSGDLKSSYIYVGNEGSAHGAVYQTGGNVVATNGTIGDLLSIGNIAGSYGYYSISGGTLTVNGIAVAGENNPTGMPWPPTPAGDGLLEVKGGTVNNLGWLVMGRGSNPETGVLNIYDGSLSFAGDGAGLNWGEEQTSIINVLGGSLYSATQEIEFRAGTGLLNLKGGVVQVNGIVGNPGHISFNGGTIRAVTNSSSLFSVGSAAVFNGGAIIDDNGHAVSLTQPMTAPIGYGVSSISLANGGSGYIAPPIVTISGGTGSNATAIATISSAGVVTGITITSPGQGYTAGDSLWVNFIGGGSMVVQPTVNTISLAANVSGGLTKVGKGTVTIAHSGNTFLGTTLVNEGRLFVTPIHQTASTFTVANGAAFGVGTTYTTNSATIGGLNLGSGGASTLEFVYSVSGNPTNALLNAGAITINGSASIRVGGIFTVGTFPILKYSSLSGSFAGLIAPRGTTATLSNDVVNKTLYAVVTSVGGGITWNGTTGLVPNLWDIDVTTNWLTGSELTTYQEASIPGDAVSFDDTGDGLVRLNSAVNPLSVAISNNVVAYTFQGSGRISGIAGLTKLGSGSATISLTNNSYTGDTVIGGGTLAVAGGSAIGDLSAVTLANVTGATLVVSNSETVGSLAGGGANGGNVLLISGADLITGGNNNSTTFGGSVTGTGRFIMRGTGALTLNGKVESTTEIWVGHEAGSTSVLDIQPGATLVSSNWLVVGRSGGTGTVNVNGGSLVHAGTGNLTLGTLGTTPSGTINLNSGSVSNMVGETYLGEGSSAVNYGTFNQSGGTAVLGNCYVGRGAGSGMGIGTANITGGTTYAGNIEIGYGNNNTRVGTNVMTIGAGATVNASGFVRLAFAGSGDLWGILTNNGGTLNIGATALYLGYWDPCNGYVTLNSGTINLFNSASIIFGQNGNNSGSSTFDQNGGSVTFYSDEGVTVGGTGSLNIGNAGSGTYTYNLNGGTLTVPQIRKVGGSGFSTFNFNGGKVVAAASSANFMEGLDAANIQADAVIDSSSHNISIAQSLADGGMGGGLVKLGAGTLALNGFNTYTGSTIVSNGALGGIGTISGQVIVRSGAALAPGDNGIGTLTLSSTPTLEGAVVMEVDRTGGNDLLELGGAPIVYGGTLVLTNTGAELQPGDSFKLFNTAGGYSGSFTVVSHTPNQNVTWNLSNLTVDGTVVVESATPVVQEPTNISFSVSGGTVSLSWPGTHLGWVLQVQTNTLGMGLSDNWQDVPGSASVTSTNIAVDPAAPAVFFRLRQP